MIELWSLIMANYNRIFQEYWYTDVSSSYSDISQFQDTDDQVIDIAVIFIRLVTKEVWLYRTSVYDKTLYHMLPVQAPRHEVRGLMHTVHVGRLYVYSTSVVLFS